MFRIGILLGWGDGAAQGQRLPSGLHSLRRVWEAGPCRKRFMETDIFTPAYQLLFSAVIKYSKEATSGRKDLLWLTAVSPVWWRRRGRVHGGSRTTRLLAHILADQDHIPTTTSTHS